MSGPRRRLADVGTDSNADSKEVVKEWLAAVRERDLRAAWPLTHPDFRADLVQAFVDRYRPGTPEDFVVDLDLARIALSAETTEHVLWPAFEESVLKEMLAWIAGIDFGQAKFAAEPRILSANEELVMLVSTAGERTGAVTVPIGETLGFVARFEDEGGWFVLRFAEPHEIAEAS